MLKYLLVLKYLNGFTGLMLGEPFLMVYDDVAVLRLKANAFVIKHVNVYWFMIITPCLLILVTWTLND